MYSSEQCTFKTLKSVRFYLFYIALNINYFEMKLYLLVEHNIAYILILFTEFFDFKIPLSNFGKKVLCVA
jgi:hypothetical protein